PPPPRESFKRAGGRRAGVAPAFATMGAVVGTDQIRNALQGVIDPELHRSIVQLDMVRAIQLSPNSVVHLTLSLPTPPRPVPSRRRRHGREARRRHSRERLLRRAER